MSKWLCIGLPLVFFLFGFGLSSVFHNYSFFSTTNKHECTSDLLFINPEPGCEMYESKLESIDYLEKSLRHQINGYITEGKAKKIAVFSRDLLTRRYFGINDTNQFVMASLLKLPLAIAYFRFSETDSNILSKQIRYDGNGSLYDEQTIKPQDELNVGHEYTVRDLLYKSLVFSDNTAAQLLVNYVTKDFFNDIKIALGLRLKSESTAEDFVTARSYAGILRTLFNASFLTRESSNQLLEILTHSTYQDGARKNLPKDVVVASKFGERTFLLVGTEKVITRQLHECGIVYAKNGKEPYSFCILTEGQNFADLQEILQDISLEIYKQLTE